MSSVPENSRSIVTPNTVDPFKHNYFTEMYSGSKAGSHLMLIDFRIIQL